MKEAEFYRKNINGLTVLFEKRHLPIVSIVNGIKFGSGDEKLNEKGIAHCIEHAVFKGTKKRKQEEISAAIEKKGGVLGAFTATDFTAFNVEMPSKHALLGLDVVRDLSCNPLFDEKEFEKEKHVILEEIRLKHDTPPAYIIMKSKELLYKKPFSLSPLGSSENVMGFTSKDLFNLFKKHYCPLNSMLCVVGNADIQELVKSLDLKSKKFSFKRPVPSKIHKSLIEKRNGLHQAHLTVGFHVPGLRDKNRYAVEAFNSILGSGMSSHLFQEVREKYGLAYAVQSLYEQGTDFGYFLVYVGTKKDNVKKVKDIVLKEIKKMASIDSKELEDAKEKLIGEKLIASESSQNTAIQLIEEELAGNATEFYKYTDRINALKLEDIKKIAKISGYSFAALVPK